MKKIIAISGESGFLGSHLSTFLQQAGYEVWPLVRRKNAGSRKIFYDYENGEIEHDKLAQCFAVIHLAGKNILSGAWKKGPGDEVYDSRVKSTQFLAQTLSKLGQGPRILLCASAIGIYGDGGSKKLTEKSKHGTGYLAELCTAWEGACIQARTAGVRVVHLRFGVIFDKSGGMLKTLLPLFKSGLGGPVGSGEQFLGYIALLDLCRAITFLLEHDELSGPINLVAPTPITNGEFAKELASVLKRPAVLRIPAFVLKLVLGQKSTMLLNSARVIPEVLLNAGFVFTYPQLRDYFSKEKFE